MRVLVAGGAGFIGSHLCTRLREEQHEVICVDNLLTGSLSSIAHLQHDPGFRYIHADVSIASDLEECRRAGCDAVFHLASPASPEWYWKHPFATIQANTTGTLNLLAIAREHNARFMLASTSEVYGNPLVHPQPETYFGNVNTVSDRACYDESKRLAETMTMEYARQYGTDVRIVRIFNTYGPRIGIDDGRMIPNFIKWALRDTPIIIHGQGAQTRSICYVSDLVEGFLRATFTEGTAGQIFNLGSVEEATVLQWAQLICDLCHSRSEIIFEPLRPDDPERRRPDITRARTLLGWEPRVAPREGIQLTIDWFRTVLP